MKSCVICGDLVEHFSHDFCDGYFHMEISRLQEKYGKVKGPSSAHQDIGEAPVDEPLTENTRH
jgi:hypothetical protein